MQDHIMPCLWFDGKAKEAADFYCSVFKKANIVSENPMVVIFDLNGNQFMGLNGGPQFTFNESVSFTISCDTQEEIDHYWYGLTANGGQESRCGWIKDQFGLSWQIVPAILGSLMSTPEKAGRVMKEVMKMSKLDIEILKNA